MIPLKCSLVNQRIYWDYLREHGWRDYLEKLGWLRQPYYWKFHTTMGNKSCIIGASWTICGPLHWRVSFLPENVCCLCFLRGEPPVSWASEWHVSYEFHESSAPPKCFNLQEAAIQYLWHHNQNKKFLCSALWLFPSYESSHVKENRNFENY